VAKVVTHRTNKKGDLEFLVRWEGYDADEDTWVSPSAFLPGYCQPWADYLKQKKLRVDVAQHLGV